ncbi:ATPase WRNIP1 [Neodiprion lecontei]|uniref:ATPase WRNIP1 n=1 Tax=Neodiprion lecontei TaxID=441921 RepID=A0ABM3FJ85_NEOLC|nr:ATPase WRNIP1 [Neodiprion lecontei]
MDCPICGKEFLASEIESHVNKCLFLNDMSKNAISSVESGGIKRFHSSGLQGNNKRKSFGPLVKKAKYLASSENLEESEENDEQSAAAGITSAESANLAPHIQQNKVGSIKKSHKDDHVPLAERVRPTGLMNYVGQKHVLGSQSVLLQLLEKKEIPSMILWGPPGCGKTSLANVIAHICKQTPGGKMRYVKLSAAMSGVNDVKEAVSRAANELKFGRRTVMFMDEIHRFNKLQQDIFLPHVEAGTVTLVGATTENPCFSLNSALLSRCRVVVLEKLTTPDLVSIIKNAVTFMEGKVFSASENASSGSSNNTVNELYSSEGEYTQSAETDESFVPTFIVDDPTVQWLAETCDGDARIALGGLELAIQSKVPAEKEFLEKGPGLITLADVKESLKKSHILYDKKGDQHYNLISALHKSVRASDDNAALYWLARMLAGGEDPMYIARRLVRMASEDVGLADPKALGMAVSVMNGCKMIGMPESDVLLAQCTIYLARAPKSRLMEDALRAAQRLVANQKGQQPDVPIHLRSTGSSKLVSLLGNGKGYNMLHKDDSGLNYMPQGMEDVNFFEEDELTSIIG